MTEIKKCPVCNASASFAVFSLKGYPYITVPVKKQNKKEILGRYTESELKNGLKPMICKNCSHVYLGKLPDEKILSVFYNKYYSYPSALEGSFIPEREAIFIKIFKRTIRKRLKKDQRKILEIGCYDGYVLLQLKRIGFEVAGCDPSEGADIGRKFGLEISKKFFDVNNYLRHKEKYDLIIFRHLLEHISKPVVFLENLKKIMLPGTLIVFEVPNVEWCLKNRNSSVFSFQHLQYFSRASVCRLAENAGYRLIDLINTGENLIAVCSAGEIRRCLPGRGALNLSRSFAADLRMRGQWLQQKLKGLTNNGIALWGGGTFSRSVIATYGIAASDINCIVDSDPNKWGMEYLEYPVAIESPEALKNNKQGCLMVCSMYTAQIMQQLRKMHYEGTIIRFHPKVTVIKRRGK